MIRPTALLLALVAPVALVALPGCAPTPPVTIVHLGKAKEDVAGDPVTVRRSATDGYGGLRGGAYVVRSSEDWTKMWPPGAEHPAVPPIDPMKEMLLVVATDDQIVSKLRVTRAVETVDRLTVWVRQTIIGQGCVGRPEERSSLDVALAPRIDKPVKFLVEDEDAPTCGEPPKAEIACRGGGAGAQAWAQKLSAKTGDVIECELKSTAKGKYELVDQLLTLEEAPPGSNAKLAFGKSSTRATLAIDRFGTYSVRAEATDEAGRRGHATATIDVLPKKTKEVQLQVTWLDLDPEDPTARAPRVLLRVSSEGAKGQRCSSEVPVPGLCEAKTQGLYTYMKIPASRRKLPLSMLYLDERPQNGPSPCVNVWFNGEKTATVCDRDHRHAEDRWELGTLETATGKIQAPKPPAEAKPKKPQAPKK